MDFRTVNTMATSSPISAQLVDVAAKSKAGNPVLTGQDRISLVSIFEEVSERFAGSAAVVCGLQQTTYRGLNNAANRVAGRILSLELPAGSVLAIYLDRSVDMIACMLGTLKAGHVFLPIDPGYPIARVQQTLDDAQPAVVFTDRQRADVLNEFVSSGYRVLLAEDPIQVENRESGNPELRSRADDLAYLMYTSGSTGKPKGVLVTHWNVVRLLRETMPWFHFNETDVWTMFHSFAFDFSVWEIWGPLLTGGKLVIVPFAVSRSPEEFYALLSEQRVTVLNQTPSAFSLLSQIEESGMTLPLALRVVIFGGEALQYRALRGWFQRHGDSRPELINMYGITETTVHVTYRKVTAQDAESEQDSLIGVPIPDLSLYLLDENLAPVKDGETGELCVGGAGVSGGYLKRPELTAQRFVVDPFGAPGATMYRSGDLARRRDDGELVYLGRGDSQVKINGFRIELGEIETALSDFPGVKQVCAIAHAGDDGRQRLVAYFVSSGQSAIATHDLSSFLSSRLPAQMMPAFYIQLASIPLTTNGKVDRVALPKPQAGSKAETTLPSSVTTSEELVAAAWRKALGADHVGMDENFFDIGGTSLLLISVRKSLQETLDRQIPITWMFECTTVKALAGRLDEQDGEKVAIAATGERGSVSTAHDQAHDQAKRQREAFARLRSARGAVR